MKPDWKNAPEWANWLAMDKDGKWWWYEYEPSIANNAQWFAADEYLEAFNWWEESKEKRP